MKKRVVKHYSETMNTKLEIYPKKGEEKEISKLADTLKKIIQENIPCSLQLNLIIHLIHYHPIQYRTLDSVVKSKWYTVCTKETLDEYINSCLKDVERTVKVLCHDFGNYWIADDIKKITISIRK